MNEPTEREYLEGLRWEDHQQWERQWWGEAVNTYGEETKQLSYLHRMGLQIINDGTGRWPVYDLAGKAVLDLGGGPASALLKTINGGDLMVVDPQPLSPWLLARYGALGIEYREQPAEELSLLSARFDECWVYNVLQHVQDPAQVLKVARGSARLVRLFEWIDSPPHLGHPHQLSAFWLREQLGDGGQVELMAENGCNGYAFYGVFPS